MGRVSSMQKKIEAMERRESNLLDQIGSLTKEIVELRLRQKRDNAAPTGMAKTVDVGSGGSKQKENKD